ncbi:LOW QUALITY PROTEIN: elastin-like [Sylvia atricapilla]|uniref:LOW QUALITY PROTEIN: elastin-like n=1 Tax=Sylvia atricapilla TaxID=48155 RepID=UPI0033912863
MSRGAPGSAARARPPAAQRLPGCGGAGPAAGARVRVRAAGGGGRKEAGLARERACGAGVRGKGAMENVGDSLRSTARVPRTCWGRAARAGSGAVRRPSLGCPERLLLPAEGSGGLPGAAPVASPLLGHSITERVRLEGTTVEHLVHPLLKQGHLGAHGT